MLNLFLFKRVTIVGWFCASFFKKKVTRDEPPMNDSPVIKKAKGFVACTLGCFDEGFSRR